MIESILLFSTWGLEIFAMFKCPLCVFLSTEPDVCFLTFSSMFCLEEFSVAWNVTFRSIISSKIFHRSMTQHTPRDAYLKTLNETPLPRRCLPSDYHSIQTCMHSAIILLCFPLIHLALVPVSLDLEFHIFQMFPSSYPKQVTQNWMHCIFPTHQIFLRTTLLLKAWTWYPSSLEMDICLRKYNNSLQLHTEWLITASYFVFLFFF